MLVTVKKEFRWEMGHRLPYHETCRNVHGHSYRMEVAVTGEPDESGMVVDFGDISMAVRPILELLDHSFMVDPWDALMGDFLEQSNLKTTKVSFYSTAENIAAWILEQLTHPLLQNARLSELRVTVDETSTSSATVVATRARPNP